jgi:hypothetical protein
MQGAEDFGQPLQFTVEWRGRVLGPHGVRKAGEKHEDDGEQAV